ncbi:MULTISPECIES: prolyl aminopeptidase [Methylotenera]|uniref:prolyl aminopeptidase n=1 Tax=Methylotenera TaxID=359407 RepID=UPI000377B548|nr:MULTISPECIES: prolyl aminopeptidase [Methylotenera]
MSETLYNLYPELEPFNKNWLKVNDFHQIYYEECGNPHGIPVIFLHGGPGSGCNPTQRRFFDPKHYRIVLLDQRGCGRSLPVGEVKFNTTDDLVADIEKLRSHLSIDTWHVFGGSWGSTLALAYAVNHSKQVISLVLRGIFLSRPSELNWFLGDVQHFYPEVWYKLISYLPIEKQNDVLNAYAELIFNDDMHINTAAAVQWNAFESAIMRLKPATNDSPKEDVIKTKEQLQQEQATEVARARVQIHYIQHRCFIDGEALLKQTAILANIPTIIVQGRYDMVCPPQTAWALHQVMPHAQLTMVADAGHSAMELGVTSALVAATEQFKSLK